MNDHRVLIVSSDPSACNGMLDSFHHTGCQLMAVASSGEAIRMARSMQPEVVLVDEVSDEVDPLEVSWQIRAAVDPARCPIFVLPCRGGQSKRAADGGCPDDAEESCLENLLTRVTSYLRRPATKEAEVVVCHDLEIDRGRHRVVADGQPLQLTPTEFRLLWRFATLPGYVFSRAELAKSCLGPNNSSQVRTIDTHIKSLRHKLGPRSKLIETVRGVGYRFLEPSFDPTIRNSYSSSSSSSSSRSA